METALRSENALHSQDASKLLGFHKKHRNQQIQILNPCGNFGSVIGELSTLNIPPTNVGPVTSYK